MSGQPRDAVPRCRHRCRRWWPRSFPHAEPMPYHLMLRTWTLCVVAAGARRGDLHGRLLHPRGRRLPRRRGRVGGLPGRLVRRQRRGEHRHREPRSAGSARSQPRDRLDDPGHLVRDPVRAPDAAPVAGVRRTPHAVAVPRRLPRARLPRARAPRCWWALSCRLRPGTSWGPSSTRSRCPPPSALWWCCSPRRCRPPGRSTSSGATCCRPSARSPAAGGWRSSGPRRCSRWRTAPRTSRCSSTGSRSGVIAGWLVTRTGGLEAGIALHIINNFVAFGFALSFGDLSDDAQRHRGQLVEHRAHGDAVRRLHRPGAGGGPLVRSADPHPPAGHHRATGRRTSPSPTA